MWPFGRSATLEEVRGHKTVKVNGMKFTIRRLNPLVDFPTDKIPQIFTSFKTRRPDVASDSPESLRRAQEDMYNTLRAGLVDPPLVQEEAKEGMKASDLFRDPTMGPKLFIEIVSHSLTVFRGLKGLFFFHKTKYWLWTLWLKDMGERRLKSLSPMAG